MNESLRQNVWLYLQLTTGSLLYAVAVALFLVPADIVPGGIVGLATIINHYTGLPIGVQVILMNIPIMIIAYRMLPGGLKMVLQAVYVFLTFSLFIDFIPLLLPETGITDDRLLNGVFGAVVGGIAGGIVYRTGASFGGTSAIALIIQRRYGLPLSTTFLYTDVAIVLLAGVAFNIEGMLYALVVLVLNSMASDYAMEGPSVIRTAFIITQKPEVVSQAIMERLNRGVTLIPAKGMYTGQDRPLLYVTISRPQVADLRDVVSNADEDAFIVIGQGHTAYGGGFRRVRRKASKVHEVA